MLAEIGTLYVWVFWVIAGDLAIFERFPRLELEGYQGHDKVLDLHYLSIACITTLRDWSSHVALQVCRLLFYWRLVGVALFEFIQLRWLLGHRHKDRPGHQDATPNRPLTSPHWV